MQAHWEKTTRQTKIKMDRQSKKTLEKIGIQDMEAVAQDRERWKLICVAVMGFNGLTKV